MANLKCLKVSVCITVLVKKGSETREYFAKACEESALAKRSRYLRTNVREVHEMHSTMVAVRIRIGIYTVRKLRDNTVANFLIIQLLWVYDFVFTK